MCEKLSRVIITSSESKASSWVDYFSSMGIPASSVKKEKFADEPHELCSMKLGREKLSWFASSPKVHSELEQIGERSVLLAAMDVNGYMPGHDKYETLEVTTCRGVGSELTKASSTAIELINRGDDYVGRLGFANVCGYGLYSEGALTWATSRYESAMLTISKPLLYEMANPVSWRKILEIGQSNGVETPLLQADSTGATRWDIIADYAPIVAKVMGIDAWVGWENGRGDLWIADNNGVTPGMKDEMSRHLRGFPLSVLNYLADLPI